MKIKNLKVENFKILKGTHEINFDSNLIFLVGENNSGKSTILESINYLVNGPEKDKKYKTNSATTTEFVTVEAVLEGDFDNLVDDLKKYEPYIYADGDKKFIKIKRSDKEEKITQNKKEVTLDESKIQAYNPTTQQFENPAGKDTTFKNFLDTVFVWSDTLPSDIIDFGTTKILGKLVNKYSKEFFASDKYKEFQATHEQIFHLDDDSLQKKLEGLSNSITAIFKEQYGEASVQFNFGLVDNAAYVKNGSLFVEENGNKDDLINKGSGMQRAIALSIIQLFSNVGDIASENKLIFCIDEPELNLHPKAQEKLLEALIQISSNLQIFVTSHSPYILKKFSKLDHKVFICKKNPNVVVSPIEDLSIVSWGPTLSEIDYFAYDISSKELYNELFSCLEYLVEQDLKLKTKVELYLTETKKITQIPYVRLKRDATTVNENWTHLSVIRHKIHHQENTHNTALASAEIVSGVAELIALISELKT